nr:MAG TPA: hypothetical protein [Caudoviricetes sp.]
MSRLDGLLTVVVQRFPRVSGDEPSASASGTALSWFSPRERG